MSSNINAGESRGQAQAKTESWMDSAKNTANAAHDKAAEATNTSQGQAQRQKEDTSGFLQQTGESMVHMAQGAIDGVKNTLGVGDHNNQQKK